MRRADRSPKFSRNFTYRSEIAHLNLFKIFAHCGKFARRLCLQILLALRVFCLAAVLLRCAPDIKHSAIAFEISRRGLQTACEIELYILRAEILPSRARRL